MRKKSFACVMPKTILQAFMIILCGGSSGFAAEIDPGLLLLDAVRQFNGVQTYTCRLDKRVVKSGRLHEDLSIFVKYRKPAHYYFRWDKGSRAGQEVIFAAGKHGGKIMAHPGGWFRFITLRLNPDGRLAMKENRHSLRHSGLEKIISIIEADFLRSRREGLVALHYAGEDWLDDSSVWVLEGRFAKNQGYYAEKVILYIDQTLRLPVKVSVYNGKNTLLEEYVFHHLKINVGWTALDFDPDNPDYNF